MSDPRQATRRRRIVAVGALMSLLILAGQGAWRSPRTIAAIVPDSIIRLLDGSPQLTTGNDGRLTVLLLGSDARGSGIARTDAITVVSLKGKSITAVSIPRDMARIPLPGGGTHEGKINALLGQYARTRSVDDALAEFEKVVEHFLGIEIDYHALIKFTGFDELIGEIEPVTLQVRKEVRDDKLHDDPNRPGGVYFPARSGYELYMLHPVGLPRCNGLWRQQSGAIAEQYWCHRALMYARTRKGPANSDYARARRHQDLVMAAIRRVIERGSGSRLDALLAAANGQVSARELWTNIPLSAANALAMYNDLDGASLDFQAVFSPSTYASGIPGSSGIQPKIDAIRAYTKQHMAGSGVPAASPTPGGQPTLTPAASSTTNPTPTARASGTATPPPPSQAPAATMTATASLAPTATPSPTATLSPTAAPSPAATASADESAADSPGPPVATSSPTAAGGVVGTPPASPAGAPPTGGAALPPAPATGNGGLDILLVGAIAAGALAAGGLLTLVGRRRIRTGRLGRRQ
jgi:anionic cell wall polymer biosynthesis LytR-Cps2A-Psr (LCP) family protein